MHKALSVLSPVSNFIDSYTPPSPHRGKASYGRKRARIKIRIPLCVRYDRNMRVRMAFVPIRRPEPLALAIAAHNRATIFFGRQAFTASFRGPLFHDLGQLNSLDRAD